LSLSGLDTVSPGFRIVTDPILVLYPLDNINFAVAPPTENFQDVKNHTDNRHGIIGYLDDATIAGRILDG
jgi:hypothetical protein